MQNRVELFLSRMFGSTIFLVNHSIFIILGAQKSRDRPLSNESKHINFLRGKVFFRARWKKVCIKLFDTLYLWTRIHWKPIDFMWLDYGFSWKSATSSNSSSVMPATLGMLRHDFNTYSARSRDLGGHYNPKFAARNRKKSEKVGKFRFWAIRRCVRP